MVTNPAFNSYLVWSKLRLKQFAIIITPTICYLYYNQYFNHQQNQYPCHTIIVTDSLHLYVRRRPSNRPRKSLAIPNITFFISLLSNCHNKWWRTRKHRPTLHHLTYPHSWANIKYVSNHTLQGPGKGGLHNQNLDPKWPTSFPRWSVTEYIPVSPFSFVSRGGILVYFRLGDGTNRRLKFMELWEMCAVDMLMWMLNISIRLWHFFIFYMYFFLFFFPRSRSP